MHGSYLGLLLDQVTICVGCIGNGRAYMAGELEGWGEWGEGSEGSSNLSLCGLCCCGLVVVAADARVVGGPLRILIPLSPLP